MTESNDKSNLFALIRKVHEESLELNRQGELSEIQKKLITLRLSDSNGMQVLLMIAAAIITAILSSLITSPFRLSNEVRALIMVILVAAATIGTVVWIKKRVRSRINKTLESKIESGLGKYCFDYKKKKYIATCEGKSLEPLFAIILLPRAYKFYYLKEPLVLLSAEPCDPEAVSSYEPKTDSLFATLQEAIGFEISDLSANRNGQLTEQQKSIFKRELKKGQQTVYYALGYGSRKPYGEVSTAAGVLDLGMNLLGPLPNAIYYFAKTVSPSEKYIYYIGDSQFVVPGEAWAALLEGFLYKAYYLEGTSKILSIELVPE